MADAQQEVQRLRELLNMREKQVACLFEGLRLTQEYVQLPARHGWSWYDAMTAAIREEPHPATRESWTGWLDNERANYAIRREREDRGHLRVPPAPDPVIDPDCRAGKHDVCAGGPCECECHR